MTAPTAGDRAPEVHFQGPDGPVTLHEALRKGPLVLLFFQEASTPACEAELRGFAGDYDLVQELGGRVLAVSVDPPEAQQRFAGQIGAPFPLLSDAGGAAARAFGVYDAAGRRSNRAVFVIAQDGTVRLALPWYNPQNSAQFEEVFTALGLQPGAGF
jgi:peroxiredoxin